MSSGRYMTSLRVLRVWRDLSMEEKKYLVQVLPPMDSAVQVIRKIVMDQNITSAGIIFDDSFGK